MKDAPCRGLLFSHHSFFHWMNLIRSFIGFGFIFFGISSFRSCERKQVLLTLLLGCLHFFDLRLYLCQFTRRLLKFPFFFAINSKAEDSSSSLSSEAEDDDESSYP